VIRAFDSRLDGCEFDSRLPRLIRLLAGKPAKYFAKPPRPTQLPTRRGTGNDYQPKCGDDLRLGRYGSILGEEAIASQSDGNTLWRAFERYSRVRL